MDSVDGQCQYCQRATLTYHGVNVQQDNHPRNIQIAGRTVRCISIDDRALLLQAKSIEADPTAADTLGIGRLHFIKDACQRYSVGQAQRLVNLAIVRLERSAVR